MLAPVRWLRRRNGRRGGGDGAGSCAVRAPARRRAVPAPRARRVSRRAPARRPPRIAWSGSALRAAPPPGRPHRCSPPSRPGPGAGGRRPGTQARQAGQARRSLLPGAPLRVRPPAPPRVRAARAPAPRQRPRAGPAARPGRSAQMATQVEPLLPAGAALLQADEHGLARKKPAPDAQAEPGPGDGGGEPDGSTRRPRPACARPSRDGAERESPRPPAAAEAPAGSDGEDGGRRDFVEAPPPKVNPWTKHAPPPAAVNGQPPPGGSARRGIGPRGDAGVSLRAGLPGQQRLVATARLGPCWPDRAGRGRSVCAPCALCSLCSLCVLAPRECVFGEHVSRL